MIFPYIRSSLWSTFEFCPLKAYMIYQLGWQETPNPKTECGTRLHKVMEILGKIKKCRQDKVDVYKDDIVGDINVYEYDFDKIISQVCDYYYYKSDITKYRTKHLQEKGFHPDNFPLIFRKDYCKKDFYTKGKFEDGVKTDYPELCSILNDLRENPDRCTIQELIDLYRLPDEQKVRIWINKALMYNYGMFDPLNKHILDVEIRFNIKVPYDWASYQYVDKDGILQTNQLTLNGTIDQINVLADDTYEILDWKGLPLETKIPTPSGWTTMGEISVGNELFDQYGQVCKVVGKSKVKYKDCYKIEFDDTSSVICDDEHLWKISNGNVIPITELKIGDKINVTNAIECKNIELPIDPYVLGVWLGDESGTRSNTIIGLTTELRKLNLINNKHIPLIYLRSSIQQRMLLLQGLMDTVGKANPTRKQAIFTSCDKQLSDCVKELLLSLGQRPLQSFVKTDTNFKKNVKVYPISFRPLDINPFLLPRKRKQIKNWGYGDSKTRRIISITKIEEKKETQCISVNSNDNTYLCTENFIPTHNTGRRYDWGNDCEKTPEKLKNDPQLRLYHYVAHQLYPNINNIMVTIFFINDGGAYSLFFNKDELPKTEEMIKSIYMDMKAVEVPRQNRSWKCKSFCHFGRHPVDHPSIKPIVEHRDGQINNKGETMCSCSQINYYLENRPINKVTENLRLPGFDNTYYKAPGE